MKPTGRDRLIDLDAYLSAPARTYRRSNHRARTVINLALALVPGVGRLAATDYALASGAPGHVVKRLMHDTARLI